jgi:hypothetical protein
MELHPFAYKSEEWLDHFRSAAEFSRGPNVETDEWMDRYFREHYPNPEEARYKKVRLRAALSFMEEHAKVFDHGRIGVVDGKNAIIQGSLVYALLSYFGSMPEHQVGRVWPPAKDVRDLAQSIAVKYGA